MVKTLRYIYCDHPECSTEPREVAPQIDMTIKETREAASRHGWVRVRRKDYCEYHAKQLKPDK